MSRISLKLVGASGQGINSVGAVLAKGVKRAGYCVFAYREYPSLIKGGHASYQLDISNERLCSSETTVNALIALNHHGLERNIEDLKSGGILLHVTPHWNFPACHQALIRSRALKVIYLPLDELLAQLGATAVNANVLVAAYLWSLLNLGIEALKFLVAAKFSKKKGLLDLNMRCIEAGFALVPPEVKKSAFALPAPNAEFAAHLLITGSQAMGLGAIHAGVRFYAGYPITPSSPLLSFIAELQDQTHMVVKQAEDEITAAQMVSGAMYMGTRALTATSGAGLDLMAETVSLNAMIENPTVFVLAQRPGPATGLPTWTAQADLLQAVNIGHGEFARCVLSVSDSQDAFDLLPVAFNLAELYQICVLVLTEKQIAEALFTQAPYDQENAEIDRGKLLTERSSLAAVKPWDRFDPEAKQGISPRWLPGSEAPTYCAQGDEHDAGGHVDEAGANAQAQMEKRMRKQQTLKAQIPQPQLSVAGPHGAPLTSLDADDPLDLLVVSWGSTSGVIRDILGSEELRSRRIAHLHFTYLWPLRTERLQHLVERAQRTVLVEQNFQGQLGMLIRMECGLNIADKILKYDGRPFFYDELLSLLREQLALNGIHGSHSASATIGASP